jgi:hypothetical protein
MKQDIRDGHVARVERDGFTIVEDAIEPALVDALNAALVRLELERDEARHERLRRPQNGARLQSSGFRRAVRKRARA